MATQPRQTAMLQRISSTFLLTAFAAVSLLGHGGLHLLPGGHDCHGGHSHASDEADGHSHCHHHGTHSHADGEAQEPDDAPQTPAPFEHDHENCVVCQWHAHGQILAVDVAIPLSDVCFCDIIESSAQVATSFRLTTLFTRGPPRLG